MYGCIRSKFDGTEKKFVGVKGMELPGSYSYRKFLPKVLNQRTHPICVPCSLSAHLNWNKNVDTDGVNQRDNNVDLYEIFDSRTTKGNDGMTFKDALKFLRHHGVDSDYGTMKIEKYALVGGEIQMKQALLLNGPLVGALPVYNNGTHFWQKSKGGEFNGVHAIAIVGYDEKGFIIRNSWGTSFGDKGYAHMDTEDLHYFYEIWTIVD